MADLQRLSDALMKAHEAGNAEHARVLAGEIRRQQRLQAEMRERGFTAPFGDPDGPWVSPRPSYTPSEYAGRGLANVAGAPADAAAWVANLAGAEIERPYFGSDRIAGAMENIAPVAPPYAEPETWAQAGALGLGEAAGFAPLGLGTAGAAARYGGPRAARLAEKYVLEPFLKHPRSTTALELGAGYGAGAGGHLGREQGREEGMDPNAAEAAGALLGGGAAVMAPGAIPRAVAAATRASPAAAWVTRNFAPFNRQGAALRAERRMQEISADPAAGAAALDEPAIADLTPAQRTGQRGPMALERAARANDPVLDARLRAQAEGAEEDLRRAIIDMAEGGSAKDFRAFVEGERLRIEGELTDAVDLAYRRAEVATARLAPTESREAVSNTLRRELDAALKAARAEETRLWGLVPDTVPAGTTEAKAAYINAKQELGRATQDRMPSTARRLLDPDNSNTVFQAKESVHEMRELMSEMRTVAREARAAGDFRAAGIADAIADGVLKDLNAITEVSAPLSTARTYSRELHKKFTQGRVGKVLGYEGVGGKSVPEGLTMDVLAGQAGMKGAVSIDDLQRAVGDRPDAMAAVEDYLKRRFTEHSMVRGEFKPEKAVDFLRLNADLLERFPALKNLMHDSAQAGVVAHGLRETVEGAIKETGRGSVAGRIAAAKGGREYATILKAQNVPQAAREALRLARGDKTGAALRGLKAAALDDLIATSSSGGTLSGKSLRLALAEPDRRAALGHILSKAEMRRLGQISQELEKLAASQGQLPEIGGVINDPINRIINMLGTLLGSGSGVRAAKGFGGHSLVVSGFFTRNTRDLLGAMTNNQAERLLREAVTDPELMKALLTSVDSPAAAARVEKRLAPFLMAEFGHGVGEMRETESRLAPRASPLPTPRGEGRRASITTTRPNVNIADLAPGARTRFLNLQRNFGQRLPVRSAVRTPEENLAAGGAEHSRHMAEEGGDALDIDTSGMTQAQVQKLIQAASAAGFTGIGVYKGNIHVDTGDLRAWGPKDSTGKYRLVNVPPAFRAVIRGHLDGRFRKGS